VHGDQKTAEKAGEKSCVLKKAYKKGSRIQEKEILSFPKVQKAILERRGRLLRGIFG
jgi:hypothetical protein